MAQVESDAPIKVTLVVPGPMAPAWLRNIVVALRDADFVSLSVVAAAIECDERDTGSSLFGLWMWLERTIFADKIAAAGNCEELVDVAAELDSKRSVTVGALSEVHGSIAPGSADLVVWMLPARPPAELVAQEDRGVVTIADAFQRAFGFREFVDQAPATGCDVVMYGRTPDEDRILASSFAATDPVLFARGIGIARAKGQALLMSSIKRLWRQVDPKLDGLPGVATAPVDRRPPNFVHTAWGLLHFVFRYIAVQLMKPFYFDQWQLAYRTGGDRLDQKGLQRLAPSHSGFWADPFVVEREGRKFIYFEEYSSTTCRGHIVAMEIFPDGQVGEPVNVLMLEHHLSYPFLLEYGGDLYMIPECAESGRVAAYRCVEFPQRWKLHAVLLDGVRAFDPTLVEHDGLWWMFVTIQHDGNSVNDELHLFHAPGPFEEWTSHPLNPVRLDVRATRPAGAIFRDNGKLLRPAQDCSGRYGRAISIQEVRCMTPENYEEVELLRISADWAAGAHATHTINQASGVTIYDCEIRRRK